jgi:undecaprenyl-phosphate 4-deoxy-4-formamido-L-arabinose transferase
VQLVILGIVGEYLGRLYLTANKKPQSVVKSVIRTAATLPGGGPDPGLQTIEAACAPVPLRERV